MEPSSLADAWEQNADIRHFLRAEGALIRWTKRETVGVVSLATLGLNHKVMSVLADIHCPTALKCKAPRVAFIKQEALDFQQHGLLGEDGQ